MVGLQSFKFFANVSKVSTKYIFPMEFTNLLKPFIESKKDDKND